MFTGAKVCAKYRRETDEASLAKVETRYTMRMDCAYPKMLKSARVEDYQVLPLQYAEKDRIPVLAVKPRRK